MKTAAQAKSDTLVNINRMYNNLSDSERSIVDTTLVRNLSSISKEIDRAIWNGKMTIPSFPLSPLFEGDHNLIMLTLYKYHLLDALKQHGYQVEELHGDGGIHLFISWEK